MSQRYFKLISTRANMEDWVVSEFFAGRARFGWSPPGTDLRVREQGTVPWRDWPEDIRGSWGRTKFLVERIEPGHRVVMQTRQPLRDFLIGEVVDPGYGYDGTQDDFNHYLHVQPLVRQLVPTNSEHVPESLKRDLSKRGHYYEIYPERSIEALDEIVRKASSPDFDVSVERTERRAFDEAAERSRRQLAKVIHDTWRVQDFEKFCADLLQSLPYVEVKEQSDKRLGWDMLVRFMNPITGEVLLDDVPVQCKNYTGAVTTERPIEDLTRCIDNHKHASRAMLLIMGELSDAYLKRIEDSAATLSGKYGREIVLDVVGEDRIAELYAATLALSAVGVDEN